VQQVQSESGGVQSVANGVRQLARRLVLAERHLDDVLPGIGEVVILRAVMRGIAGGDPLRYFMAMDGDLVRRFDAKANLVACDAEDFHANA
jgi:hypothetical protein